MNSGFVRVDDCISYLPGTDEPLSCDIFLVKGRKYAWFVDVGRGNRPLESILTVPDKKIIITHFHGDHTENLKDLEVPDSDLYVGDYTFKSIGRGTPVSATLSFEDGVDIKIIPMPSSHSKGSLTVLVNGKFLIMGDSYYGSDRGYNVSLLYDQIKVLKETDFEYGLFGHGGSRKTKAEMVAELERIYSMREKGNPWINKYR